MQTQVLICDDSGMARKQLARALPAAWDIDIAFAEDGIQALEAIRAGKGDVLFLDLNMPGMDGYEVLAAIRESDLPTTVIVVSGDIQPEAHKRVSALGALDFLKKPVATDELSAALERYGLFSGSSSGTREVDVQFDIWDCYREMANVATGRAADLLARLLEVFVIMPIPKINMIEKNDIHMTLTHVAGEDAISAVCQGFIGASIAGEAFLIFNESSYADIARLMHYEGDIDENAQLELLMDISNVLIGACLNAVSEQLDLEFNIGHPVVLGRHIHIDNLTDNNKLHWKHCLAMEMSYTIEAHKINCDLLLLFTEDSMPEMEKRIAHLAN